jgi:hypothetical protein
VAFNCWFLTVATGNAGGDKMDGTSAGIDEGWTIERTFSWLHNYRRLLVRHDRLLTVYRAFFHVACMMITLRYL